MLSTVLAWLPRNSFGAEETKCDEYYKHKFLLPVNGNAAVDWSNIRIWN